MLQEQLAMPAFRGALVLYRLADGWVVNHLWMDMTPQGQQVMQKQTIMSDTSGPIRQLLDEFMAAYSEIATGVVDSSAKTEAQTIESKLRQK